VVDGLVWLVHGDGSVPAFAVCGPPGLPSLVTLGHLHARQRNNMTKRNGEPGLKVSLRKSFVRRMLVTPTTARGPLLTCCGIGFRSVWNLVHTTYCAMW
jgi:hypothetical protein